jgi:uncharacterized membrane protein YhdT
VVHGSVEGMPRSRVEIFQFDFTCFNIRILFILIIWIHCVSLFFKIVFTRLMMAQYAGRNI